MAALFALESAGHNDSRLCCLGEQPGEQPDCLAFHLDRQSLHPRASDANAIIHIS
jgi:hypothetical protein